MPAQTVDATLACSDLPESGSPRSFGNARDYAHENPPAVLHLKTSTQRFQVGITIGIDLGDIWSRYCTLNEDGEVVDRGRFRTNPSWVDKRYGIAKSLASFTAANLRYER